jgi:hypothetical protein
MPSQKSSFVANIPRKHDPDANDNDGMMMGDKKLASTVPIHPRQQSTNDDSWGGRRQKRGTIVGDGMTEKGQVGGDLVTEIDPVTAAVQQQCQQRQW